MALNYDGTVLAVVVKRQYLPGNNGSVVTFELSDVSLNTIHAFIGEDIKKLVNIL